MYVKVSNPKIFRKVDPQKIIKGVQVRQPFCVPACFKLSSYGRKITFQPFLFLPVTYISP